MIVCRLTERQQAHALLTRLFDPWNPGGPVLKFDRTYSEYGSNYHQSLAEFT